MFQTLKNYKYMPVILTGIFLFLFSSVTLAQISRQWVNRFNGTANSFDIVSELIPDDSGNVFVYGTSFNNSTLTDFTILKYSSSGIPLINKSFNYGTNSYDQLKTAVRDNDGNSYLVGLTSQGTDNNKLLTVKLNPNADQEWSSIYNKDGYSNFIGKDIIYFNNFIYVLANATFSNGRKDEFLLKYNPQGQLINENILTVPGSITMESLNLTFSGNGFLVSSSTVNFSNTISRLHIIVYNQNLLSQSIFPLSVSLGLERFIKLIKVDSDKFYFTGTKVTPLNDVDFQFGSLTVENSGSVSLNWIRTFNGSGNHYDFPFDIASDSENNIYITGSSRNGSILGTEDVVTLKYSPSGNLIWQKNYNSLTNGIDQGMSITVDNSGNVYVGGASDLGNVKLAFLILKYSLSGNLLFEDKYSYAENPEDFVYSVAVNNANDFFITGISFNPGTDYDFATLKYSASSFVGYNNESINSFKLNQNYPNPFNPETNISFSLIKSGIVSLNVFDSKGLFVKKLINEFKISGEYNYKFNADDLPSGIYFYKLDSDNYSQSKKMILIK